MPANVPREVNSPREPIVWPVAGFDSDLLSRADLDKHKAKLAMPLLRQGLVDGRVAVRVNALNAVLLHGPVQDADLDLVLTLLRDPSPSVRLAAVGVLAGAPASERVITALLQVADKDPQLGGDVAAAIRTMGVQALPTLMAALRTDASVADRTILPHIIALEDAGLTALGTALAHPDVRVRSNALAGLMVAGTDKLARYQPLVVALGRDAEPTMRLLARQALTMMSRASSPSHAAAKPLPVEDFADRPADEVALQKIAKQVEAHALLALTRDGREMVRQNAWRSMQLLATLTDDAAMMAGVAVRDADPFVRREAALALRKCPDHVLDQVFGPLILASRDADKTVVQAARQSVLGHGKKALALLIGHLSNRSVQLQEGAIALLVRFDTDAVPVLRQALQGGLPTTRENALIALAEIGGKGLDESADAVAALLTDSQDGVRQQALRSMARMSASVLQKRKPVWLPLVQARQQDDASLAVRNAARDLASLLAAQS